MAEVLGPDDGQEGTGGVEADLLGPDQHARLAAGRHIGEVELAERSVRDLVPEGGIQDDREKSCHKRDPTQDELQDSLHDASFLGSHVRCHNSFDVPTVPKVTDQNVLRTTGTKSLATVYADWLGQYGHIARNREIDHVNVNANANGRGGADSR